MVGAIDELERGREAYGRRAWREAHESLARADGSGALEAQDLELLATSAYMVGRDDEYLAILERAHQAHLDAGESLRAVRCAFWVGINLARRGEMGGASGWLGRAQRLIDGEAGDAVERGYLLLPAIFQHEASGELDAAASAAGEAAQMGERLGDRDLFALAVHEQGHILIRQGRIERGLALLDEAMVCVTTGELSPIVSGLVYCGVIAGCQEAFEVRRAREWTAALTRWCEEQPEMVAFTGRCLVHRAEILQLGGAWQDALEEARRAGERSTQAANRAAAGEAHYRRGELHRLRGEFDHAEDAYREANRCGWEPQPGLALMRLAQGAGGAAAAALGRGLAEGGERPRQTRLLPAYVEVLLATGDVVGARRASEKLQQIARDYEGGMVRAMAEQAAGAVELAEGNVEEALVTLRGALRRWQELDAPYEAGRTRVLVGRACRDLGDEDTAALELDAARATFEELQAAPDLSELESLGSGEESEPKHGLTDRELQVLGLVAAGKSNREIAKELVISEHTVARHLQNIFNKLCVSSRTAASAFAFKNDLV